jgi:hypothetical protein
MGSQGRDPERADRLPVRSSRDEEGPFTGDEAAKEAPE